MRFKVLLVDQEATLAAAKEAGALELGYGQWSETDRITSTVLWAMHYRTYELFDVRVLCRDALPTLEIPFSNWRSLATGDLVTDQESKISWIFVRAGFWIRLPDSQAPSPLLN